MPSTLPSRRCSRSTRDSSKPSRVPATASSRSIDVLAGRGRDQQAQAGVAAPADPAAQLVQLGDTEAVGVDDHHHGGVGDVHADLDDRRGHEDVDLAGRERLHHGVLLVRRHPAVQHLHPQTVQRSWRPAAGPAPRPRAAAGVVASAGRSAPRPRRRSAGRRRRPDGPRRPPRGPAARRARATTGARTAPRRWSARRRGRRAARSASRSPGRRRPSSRPCAGSGSRSSRARAAAPAALAVRAARCSTPNRCCSSTTTSPRSANCTFSSSRAWVPITMPGRPGAGVEHRLAPGGGSEGPGQQRDLGAVGGAAEHAALRRGHRASR